MTRRVTAVLSGGGAKAAAHLGALRVLEAEGVVPDRYVATSMGAVIAAALGAGMTLPALEAQLLSVRQREVFRLDRRGMLKGIWAHALLQPEPLRRTLQRLLPVERFAELTLPVSITATDLDSGAQLVFGAGGEDVPLLDALCASCALPLFFPPVVLGGRRCADGGLRAVVPLEVAARFPTDLVVAIDVGPGFDMLPQESGPLAPALIRLHSDAQRTLMAANTLAQRALWRSEAERPPLLWIRPRIRRGETFATDQVRWYLEEGARAARAELAQRQT